MFTYEILKYKKNGLYGEELFKNVIDDVFETDEKRHFSNQLAIFMYAMIWFFVVMGYIFEGNADILRANDYYTPFDMVAILYIILLTKVQFIEEKQFLMYSGKEWIENMVYIIKGLVYSTIIILLLVGTWEILFRLFVDNLIIYPHGYEGNGGNGIGLDFHLLRIIPLEEFAFRGLGILLINGIFYRMFGLYDDDGYQDSSVEKTRPFYIKYTISWIITILVTGILFGAYHIPKFVSLGYYPNIPTYYNGVLCYLPIYVPIIYLSLLGIILGYIHHRYGLLVAWWAHFVNNFWAIVMGSMLVGN